MPAKKVLYVSHAAGYHGAVMSLLTLVRGLDRERFTPFAAFSKDGPVVSDLANEGIEARVLMKRGVFGTGLIREAYLLIRSRGIDLVHLNNAVKFCKYVAIAARLAGVPVVWHVREPASDKRLLRLAPWIRRLSARIAVISSELEALFADTGKAVRIINGVDTELFNPATDGAAFRARLGFGPDDFVFLFVGTIEPRKGTMLFTEAAAEVTRKRPRARFAVVGAGMPAHEAELRRFLEERPGLSERTALTGRIKDVPEAMAASDVVVMPSLVEPFGRVIIEAMAAGRPVIASGVGEVPNIIQDKVTGMIFTKGDAGALAGLMDGCFDAGGMLKEMGEAARARAIESYGVEAHVLAVQGVYDAVLGGRKGA